MKHETITELMVRRLISVLPRGKADRISQAALAERLDVSERVLRRLIEIAIGDYSDLIFEETGCMICSSCSYGESGYWLSDDIADIRAAYNEGNSRLCSTSHRLKAYRDYLKAHEEEKEAMPVTSQQGA